MTMEMEQLHENVDISDLDINVRAGHKNRIPLYV